MSKARTHLGDGAYARWDGFNIVLAVNHHNNEVVTLEPLVFQALVEFQDNCKKGLYEPCNHDEI